MNEFSTSDGPSPESADSEPPGALEGAIVAIGDVEQADLEAMWELFRTYYAGSEYRQFRSDFYEKSHVIILRDSLSSELCGFSTLQRLKLEGRRRDIVAVYSGDTVIDRAYWGQTALHNEFRKYLVRTRIRHRRCKVYWFLLSKGFKTYLLLTRNFLEYWPRWEKPTPPSAKALIDRLASRKFPDDWDPERGIIAFEDRDRLRHGVAEPPPPPRPRDIEHFLERNPGFRQGHELCCLGRVSVAMVTYSALRIAWKRCRRLLRVGRR